MASGVTLRLQASRHSRRPNTRLLGLKCLANTKSPHLNPAAVWFQLDCVHEDAIHALVAAGRTVIYDRCLMVEHARLVGND